MGVFVGEHFIFYADEKASLENLQNFLKSKCKACEKAEFGQEISLKTESEKELYGWNVSIGELLPAKNREGTFEFHLHTEQKSHSNFNALKELSEKYGVGICFEGGSAEAGGYQTYDPEGRYFINNYEQMRFSNPNVCILFERIKKDEEPVEKLGKSVGLFFEDNKIDYKTFKINENAFYVELGEFRLGSPFISPTLEQIKTGLKALKESLSLWINYGGEENFKFSIYFYIDKGAAWFNDLQPGTSEWAEAENSLIYEGKFVDITNDKNALFYKTNIFSSIINCNIATEENKNPVEKIQEIDKSKVKELKFES